MAPFKAIAMSESLEVSQDLTIAIERLRRMPAPAVVYPYTMRVLYEAIGGRLDHGIAARDLGLVESLLVRRALSGWEPTGLHAVFKTLWSDTAGSPSELIKVIDNNPTIEFPSDAQLAEAIRTKALYSRKLRYYIFWEYERGLLGGDPVPQGVTMTLDHVAPQTATTEWQDEFGGPEPYAEMLHTWANLVPLSNSLNAQKQRKTWPETQSLFATETIFKTTKRLAGQYQDWNSQAVLSRAQDLAAWAVTRWPKKA